MTLNCQSERLRERVNRDIDYNIYRQNKINDTLTHTQINVTPENCASAKVSQTVKVSYDKKLKESVYLQRLLPLY